MGFRIGNGYLGSDSIKTSVANEEIIPSIPTRTVQYSLYKFSFVNDQACHIVINNGNQIYLRASQGFEMDEIDCPIISFKIVESGITYNWVAAY